MINKRRIISLLPSLWHVLRCKTVTTFQKILPTTTENHSSMDPTNIKRDNDKKEAFEKTTTIHDEFSDKITVVGAGQVGMAIAFSLLTQKVTSNVTLIDNREDTLNGEVLDIDRGSIFLPDGVNIVGSTDYKASINSDICILSAAVARSPKENVQDVIQKNTDCFKTIVPLLVKYSPNTTLLVVSQPVDVMTHVAWCLSGLPANRIMGLGTAVDSAQFQTLIARRLGISIGDIHGWIIGEQGDRSIPVWSGVNAAGVRLRDLLPDVGTDKDKERWGEMHRDSVNNGQEIINLKGYSSWGSALSISAICRAVLGNTHHVYSVSTLVTGHFGVQQEVFLSLPCVIYRNGIQKIVNQELTTKEMEMFQSCAEMVYKTQMKIKM